jgi:hypothetical protein
MRLLILAAAAASLVAQEGPPVRILQGELLEWQVSAGAGDFSIRELDHRVHWCKIFPDTYITRQSHRINHVGVRPGDTLEVIADLRRGISHCIAMTIYVRPPETARRYPRLLLPQQPRFNFLDNLWQRGNLTFAGVLQRLEQDRMVLKTRNRGELTFLLRPDTIYSNAGKEVESTRLTPQTMVYVRAGSSFRGELEVYQVVWGDILTLR